MIRLLRYFKIFIYLALFLTLASCWTFIFTTELEQGEEGSGVPIQLATPSSMQPAAGICAEGQGKVMTMRVNPDVPDPRCLRVRPDQRLAVINGLEQGLEISLGELTATIEPGGEYSFDIPFGQILLPGVHNLGTSSCCGGAIWLMGEGSVSSSGATEPVMATEAGFPRYQGHLEFPYIAADAGNFSLQAGEEIFITWEDAPLGAEAYEIRFIDSDGVEINLSMVSTHPSEEIVTRWVVPERSSGRLEGLARYAHGGEVRSGCCSHVFTGELAPEGICSLRIHGIGVQNLYQEASEGSPRIAGIAPGLYLEVLGQTLDGWFWVKADSYIDSTFSENGSVAGWINGHANVGIHGPCADIPIVKD